MAKFHETAISMNKGIACFMRKKHRLIIYQLLLFMWNIRPQICVVAMVTRVMGC